MRDVFSSGELSVSGQGQVGTAKLVMTDHQALILYANAPFQYAFQECLAARAVRSRPTQQHVCLSISHCQLLEPERLIKQSLAVCQSQQNENIPDAAAMIAAALDAGSAVPEDSCAAGVP